MSAASSQSSGTNTGGEGNTSYSASSARSARLLPALVLLFVGSGGAALIYEITWFQMLSLVIGSSAVSLGVLLATFMGGMCIGSISLSHYVSRKAHPLRVYAWLEIGIAVLGASILLLFPLISTIYAAIGGEGVIGVAIRAIIAAIFLLPPTILMGATLPAIARWVEATPRGVSWLGFFYGGNIAGAVFGSLLAGFYLLRVHDVAIATLAAVVLNVTVALVALGMAAWARPSAGEAAAEVGSDAGGAAAGAETGSAVAAPAGSSLPILIGIAVSGMTALGAQVAWTRLLSLTMGGTVYTFSLILAAFLIGLGIGSSAGSLVARSLPDPRRAFGICQLLTMGGLAWAAYALVGSLPYWPVNPGLTITPWYTLQLDFVRALWVVLPGTIFWGASFPLALASVASGNEDPGRLVGRVYAANTVGAIVGAMVVALVLAGTVGTQVTQRILLGSAGLAAILLLGPWGRNVRRPTFNAGTLGWSATAIVLIFLLGSTVRPLPGLLAAYGRYAATWYGSEGEIVYVGEGTHASLAVTRQWSGSLNYHNAGKIQASSEPQDMRLQRMLGHFTTLIPENPRSVMVIGLGAGVTAGAVSIDPAVEKVTIVELEPLVPEVVSTYFSEHNFSVVTNPKVDIRIDDGRHFLLTTDQTFDAITSDPLDPWVKGAANLYTEEFFELVKSRLNPGGVVTIFVQLYEAGLEAVRSEIATFTRVFPNAVVWANTVNGEGYDLVLMGQVEPTHIDIVDWEERLRSPEYAPIRNSLAEIGIYSAVDLLATYAGNGESLRDWLAPAQINRDRNLRLQYLAGFGLNRYEQALIHREMIATRTFPAEMFTAPPEVMEELEWKMMGGGISFGQ